MLTSVLTSPVPRLTASRTGFLGRSTALSWPWNKDRFRAAPGTLPPSFADLALGVVDCSKPAIRMWCKDPMHREADAGGTALPVVHAQAGAQGAITRSGAERTALDPRFREDDGGSCPTAVPAQNPVHRERTGPLRNGNPRGNPNLAPRCGARTRRTGCPCRAPAMRNGRCRLHGGKSTGPRTEEGRARIRAARIRHGRYTAESRAFQRDITGLLRRNRELLSLASQPGPVDAAALRHLLLPERGKYPVQQPAPGPRPGGEAPPATGSAAAKSADKHQIHRETCGTAASAGAIRVHPPMPDGSPATRPATAAAFPAAVPIHRPLLLTRPRPFAT